MPPVSFEGPPSRRAFVVQAYLGGVRLQSDTTHSGRANAAGVGLKSDTDFSLAGVRGRPQPCDSLADAWMRDEHARHLLLVVERAHRPQRLGRG